MTGAELAAAVYEGANPDDLTDIEATSRRRDLFGDGQR